MRIIKSVFQSLQTVSLFNIPTSYLEIYFYKKHEYGSASPRRVKI